MIKVLLVDDHDLVRILIRERLEPVHDIDVVAEARSGEEAIRKARQEPFDVVLLDVNMPGIGGLETARVLKRIHPGVKIIVVTVHSDGPFPMAMLEMGVDGYLTKASAPEELLTAVRDVYHGRRFVDPKLAQSVLLGRLAGPASPLDDLTPRELEVLTMIIKGKRIPYIAERLCRSPKTISTLRTRILRKLEAESDVELTLLALRHGLIEPFDRVRRTEAAAAPQS